MPENPLYPFGFGPEDWDKAEKKTPDDEARKLRTFLDEIKQAKRRREIEEGLKEKIRVDLPALRRIMNILHFYCSKGSSILRDQAVKGSDIDNGVIIVDARNREKEDAVLAELTAQGFKVAHFDDATPAIPEDQNIRFMTPPEFADNQASLARLNLETDKEVGEY